LILRHVTDPSRSELYNVTTKPITLLHVRAKEFSFVQTKRLQILLIYSPAESLTISIWHYCGSQCHTFYKILETSQSRLATDSTVITSRSARYSSNTRQTLEYVFVDRQTYSCRDLLFRISEDVVKVLNVSSSVVRLEHVDGLC